MARGTAVPGRTTAGSCTWRWSAAPNLDLHEPPPDGRTLTVTALSLVGGVHLRVPAGVRVEARGLSLGLLGRRAWGPPAAGVSAVVRVRRFGLVGGVRVDAAAPAP